MTNNDYTHLLIKLSELKRSAPRLSESQNCTACNQATSLVRASALPQEAQSVLISAISNEANPTGYYHQNNGIQAAIDILDEPVDFAEAA